MAITSTFRSAVFSTGAATSYAGTTAWTPANGSLLIAFVVTSLGSTPLDPTSVTGHGVTFTKLTLAANTLSTTHILSAWVANAGVSPSSVAASASFGAVSQTGAALVEFEVTGWGGTDAVGAIVQNPTNTGTATSGTVTLSAAANANNRPLSFWVHLANEATTVRVNWTETVGAGGNFNTPATGAEAQFRNDAFETTASATWTTSSLWRGIALEVKADLSVNEYLPPVNQPSYRHYFASVPVPVF